MQLYLTFQKYRNTNNNLKEVFSIFVSCLELMISRDKHYASLKHIKKYFMQMCMNRYYGCVCVSLILTI